MSTFKLKNGKVRYVSDVKTLDGIHKSMVNNFQKKKNTLPKTKIKLEKMYIQLKKLENKDASTYDTKDIKLRSKLKSDIKEIEYEIYDIENNITEAEYYSKTEEYLMDYYDLIDDDVNYEYNSDEESKNISLDREIGKEKKLDKLDLLNKMNRDKRKRKTTVKKRKRRQPVNIQNNILSYFGEAKDSDTSDSDNNEDKENDTKEKKVKTKDKSILLDQYRTMIDSEYVCDKNKGHNHIKICHWCDCEKTLNQTEGFYFCDECGEIEEVIIEPERPNYREVVTDKPGYPYKRINHFNEWLSQFQAKETTEIPADVYGQIMRELHKNRIRDFKKLTLARMKKILKKLCLTQYYEHSTHIISKLSGLPPPVISRDVEDELRRMFRQIQEPFANHCPIGRINFLSYSYVLHKFCELKELDEFIHCFPLLKSREKLRQQDKIWEGICSDLRWQYIPSI